MENFGLDDKNIATLLSRIREVPEEEDEKEKEVLEKAKPKVRFYKSFGTALTRLEPTELGRRWKGPDCELILELSGRHVTLSGSYDRSVNRLALALGAPLGSLAHLATRHNIKYSARFDGYAVTGTVARTDVAPNFYPCLLYTSPSPRDGLL